MRSWGEHNVSPSSRRTGAGAGADVPLARDTRYARHTAVSDLAATDVPRAGPCTVPLSPNLDHSRPSRWFELALARARRRRGVLSGSSHVPAGGLMREAGGAALLPCPLQVRLWRR